MNTQIEQENIEEQCECSMCGEQIGISDFTKRGWIETSSETCKCYNCQKEKDTCYGCNTEFYWKQHNYTTNDKGILYCDDCIAGSDDEKEKENYDCGECYNCGIECLLDKMEKKDAQLWCRYCIVNESDDESDEKQDNCCGCHNKFYWRNLNYSSDDKGTLYCDDCMPDSDEEDEEEDEEDEEEEEKYCCERCGDKDIHKLTFVNDKHMCSFCVEDIKKYCTCINCGYEFKKRESFIWNCDTVCIECSNGFSDTEEEEESQVITINHNVYMQITMPVGIDLQNKEQVEWYKVGWNSLTYKLKDGDEITIKKEPIIQVGENTGSTIDVC